jgi:hypothetical protein
VEAWVFLGGVTLVILHLFSSGSIDIGEAQLSRMQLLAGALVLAAYYLLQVDQADPAAMQLPDAPAGSTVALGGSVFIYLANKLWGRWSELTGTGSAT